MDNINGTTLGLLLGIALGFAAAFGGFTAFIIVLLLGIAGLIAGRVYDGELDLTGYLGGRARGQRRDQ